MLHKSNPYCVWCQVFVKCVFSKLNHMSNTCESPPRPRARLLCSLSVSLSGDLIECSLSSSLSGDLTDGPGGAKERQTVGDPSSLPPSAPWIQTNDVICSSLPCVCVEPFPVTSHGIHPSPILLKVPFVSDTLQWEILLHNLGRRNKSELLLAINKLIEACGRRYREDRSYCGLPYFFHIPVFALWTPGH